jgi:hypothetical protein
MMVEDVIFGRNRQEKIRKLKQVKAREEKRREEKRSEEKSLSDKIVVFAHIHRK